MNISIRQAEQTDSESITNLSDQLGYKTTADKIAERLVKIMNNSDNCVYVACYNNAVVGWIHGCLYTHVESDAFAEIGGLVVDKDYRKKGIAKMLIAEVTQWAIVKGIHDLRVRSNTIRKETHQYYRNLGFTEIKEQKVFGRDI